MQHDDRAVAAIAVEIAGPDLVEPIRQVRVAIAARSVGACLATAFDKTSTGNEPRASDLGFGLSGMLASTLGGEVVGYDGPGHAVPWERSRAFVGAICAARMSSRMRGKSCAPRQAARSSARSWQRSRPRRRAARYCSTRTRAPPLPPLRPRRRPTRRPPAADRGTAAPGQRAGQRPPRTARSQRAVQSAISRSCWSHCSRRFSRPAISLRVPDPAWRRRQPDDGLRESGSDSLDRSRPEREELDDVGLRPGDDALGDPDDQDERRGRRRVPTPGRAAAWRRRRVSGRTRSWRFAGTSRSSTMLPERCRSALDAERPQIKGEARGEASSTTRRRGTAPRREEP